MPQDVVTLLEAQEDFKVFSMLMEPIILTRITGMVTLSGASRFVLEPHLVKWIPYYLHFYKKVGS